LAVACRAADKADVNQLNLEVDALQALAQFDLNPSQLKALAKLAPGAADTRERKPPKASARYVAGLKELRKALIDGEADTIDDLNAKMDKLREVDKPQLDDKLEAGAITKERASEALKLLTARQTADYLGNFGEELPDPVERFKETVRSGQTLTGKQWETARDHAAAEIGWLLGGFDSEKVGKFKDQAAALLDKMHGQKKQSEEAVDKAARELCAGVAPTDVLRNIVEHDLAELLANPELPAAIAAHLKK